MRRLLPLLVLTLALAVLPARAQVIEPNINLAVTWTSPGHAVVTWNWAYPACLWRAASAYRPERWLTCKGQRLTLGPGDYITDVPLAGDVYELRNESAGIVVARAELGPYATIRMPIVVQGP